MNGSAHLPVDANGLTPHNPASATRPAPSARATKTTPAPRVRSARRPRRPRIVAGRPAGAQRPALAAFQPGPMTRALHQAPVDVGRPAGRPRPPPPPNWPAGRPVSCRERHRNSWPTGPRPNRRQPGPRKAPWTGPHRTSSRAAGSLAVMPVLSKARYLGRVPVQLERLPLPADQFSLGVSQLRLSLMSGKTAKLTK